MQHELKILPQYFKEVVNGNKTFEIRKNDRGFKVGDTLLLKEYYSECREFKHLEPSKGYTGDEITKEVSYILEGGQYGLEEGYCILGLKQDGITLKNIDLTGISLIDQVKKVAEEEEELIQACENMNIDNIIEEFFDGIQAKMGILQKLGINAEDIMKEYPKHLTKIANRPRKKECKKCINKIKCCLYLSEQWNGNKEAEKCKTYKEQEE